jgi:hypothetical protein
VDVGVNAMPADGAAIVQRYERLKGERHTFDARWEKMAPYLSPSRQGITTAYSPGETQTRNVYDSTMMMAADWAARFIAGNAMNRAHRWLGYRMRHPAVRDSDPVREWLDECQDRTLARLLASEFYAEGPESTVDFVGFGTGNLLVEEAPQPIQETLEGFRGFYVQAEKIGRYVIAQGERGLVDTMMREFVLTARIARETFGAERLPEPVTQALEAGKPDQPFTFVHDVEPRPKAERKPGAAGMPWMSAWVEKQTKTVVRESGYRRFPAIVPRYERTPGEVYGRGLGDLAFPDTWTLNMAKAMGLEDWALKIRPPVLMRHDSVIGTLRLTPGGPTSVNTHGQSLRDVIAPFETGSRPEVSQLKEEELRRSIREVFQVDIIRQLLQVEKSEMTAYEFRQKLNLAFRLFAPAYGRMEWELLHQLGEVLWDLQFTAGDFPPPPPEVFDSDGIIDVTFDNPIARAQRAEDAEAWALVQADLSPIGAAKPQVWDWFDVDALAPGIATVRGLPAKWVNSREQVEAAREARFEQDQRENTLAEAGQVAEALGKAAPMAKVVAGQTPAARAAA